MQNLNEMTKSNSGLLFFATFVTLFLLIGAITDRTRSRPFMKCFILLLTSNILMLMSEGGIWFFEGSSENIPLLYFFTFLFFGIGVVWEAIYAYCLVGFVKEREGVSFKYAHIIGAICAVYLLMVVISLFNGMLFSFDADGWYMDGPWYGISQVFDFVILFLELFLVARYRKILTTEGILSLLSFSVLPLMAMPVWPYWEGTPIFLVTTLSLILMHVLFHGELTRQLIEKEHQLAENERQLTEQRIATMISQIQPHFLHNVLNSISELCSRDSQQAQDAIDDFSIYLRGNMASLSSRDLIYFPKELRHIEIYLKLEKLRFGDKLNIVYDIRESNFFVPPLVVQPLVENAVKHGIHKARNGGTVTLQTQSDNNKIWISVKDDGIGFELDGVPKDGQIHVGIQNVKKRLQQMVGGELVIESSPGKGTIATIILDKGGIKDNEYISSR